MIEMTIREMISSVSALRNISEKKMSAKTAYQFARIIREVENELKSFQEARNKLIERYGKKDENGKILEDENGNVVIFPDKKEKFDEEADDLLKTKIKINCEQVMLEDISNDNNFSPAEIGELFLFIKE